MKNPQKNSIKRPSLWLYFTEAPRAIFEYFRSRSFLKNHQFSKKGKGEPILVIPGFMTSGKSTIPLRKLLNRNGYRTYDWDLGRNLGNLNDIEKLLAKVDHLYQKNNQKITIIGWSLGGVYGRALAFEKADKIKHLITLGSPFADIQAPNNAAWLFRLINRNNNKKLEEKWLPNLPKPLPILTSAIYSKNDGIVPWESCLEKNEDETSRNFEVKGSHCGMGVNKEVLLIVESLL